MDAIVVTEEEEKIVLTSDSLKNTYMQWDSGRDTLAIYSTHLSKVWQGASKVVTDTVYFTKNEIVDVYIDEFDATKTVLVIAIPVILIAAFIIGYSNSSIIELDSWR
jgi:hypothetical protein